MSKTAEKSQVTQTWVCAVSGCVALATTSESACPIHVQRGLTFRAGDAGLPVLEWPKGDCRWCEGTGDCDHCEGSGEHICECGDEHDCRPCGGSGKCVSCRGTGDEKKRPKPVSASFSATERDYIRRAFEVVWMPPVLFERPWDEAQTAAS